MTLFSEGSVVDTAMAIERYLSTRPNASETIEGIAQWWLLRQRYDDSRELIQKALNLLMEKGVVARSRMPDGKVIYGKTLSH